MERPTTEVKRKKLRTATVFFGYIVLVRLM